MDLAASRRINHIRSSIQVHVGVFQEKGTIANSFASITEFMKEDHQDTSPILWALHRIAL